MVGDSGVIRPLKLIMRCDGGLMVVEAKWLFLR